MTPILREPIIGPMAWRGGDFTVDDIAFDLTPRHVAALKDLLNRLATISLYDIRRQDCGHPALDADLANIFRKIQYGRGIVLVRGFPVAGHSLEELEKMNWALNTHLGTMVSQNCLGHRITRVQEERLGDGKQAARGHKSSADLAMHTDYADILTLLCVRTAKSGGQSQFTSALAVHNDILERHPEVLPILYRGFPHHRRNDQPESQPAVSPYDVPIFSNVDGQISFCLIMGSILAGLHEQGRGFTPEEQAALDVLKESMARLQFELTYEEGDLMIANNLTMVHSRSEYRDWDEPEKRRMLLRLWLEPELDRRPVVKEIYPYENAGGRNGIDPVPGRKNARNEYEAIPDSLLNLIRAGQAKPGQATPSGKP